MAASAATSTAVRGRSGWYRQLYVWVLVGIVAGVVVGAAWPKAGTNLEPLGTVFVSMITMVVGPIIFVTVVGGIAGVDDLRKVGRIGIKSLIYFEGMTTVALVLGLIAIDVLHPGSSIHADPASLKLTGSAAQYAAEGRAQGFWSILTEIVPPSALGAFTSTGSDLQVVFFAVLFGVAIKLVGEPAAGVAAGVEKLGKVFFAILRIIMYAAPVGAFGAMAFTVGKYGVHTLTSLGSLIGLMYGTCAIFVIVALGAVCAAFGLNVLSLLRYIKDELLIVLGTSSSETVLPRLMRKIERAGVPEDVVGLTVPTGYSFNLDGTCIYLTLAALFVAQATGTHLSLAQQLGILAILLLTSKGAAGVTGSGFIVLAATLASVGTIPVTGIMLIFGIDRFMSTARALTNACGNAVGSFVVAAWEGVLDRDRARAVLSGATIDEDAETPALAGV
ncbi:C4-dicarboxylate transporter DctA [Actinospica sp.]|uniref:C4-dicarboxylate transporter DctA n=1 Tax=Actinospica sp. TaxID=1872142 RepID=UPI002C6A461A|nr:C4-dicarboxylate transporter DctA [Actinospica sp.]HWG23974.1 C4-dicarboxylate transporter DctA [Actinospica sp.]